MHDSNSLITGRQMGGGARIELEYLQRSVRNIYLGGIYTPEYIFIYIYLYIPPGGIYLYI